MPDTGGGLCGLALSPDGKTVAVGDDGNAVHFLDLAAGKYLDGPGIHRGIVMVVSFAADGKQVLTQGSDAVACLWDAASGKPLQRFPPPAGAHNFSVSPDGKLLAVQSKQGTITLSDRAGKVLGTVPAAHRYSAMFFFAPDSRTLLVRHYDDGKVVLHDALTGKEQCRVKTAAFSLLESRTAEDAPLSMWFFSADSRLLVGFDERNALTVWDAVTGKARHKITLPKGVVVRGGAVAPDQRMLALDLTDGRVALWELASGKLRCLLGTKPASAKPQQALAGVNSVQFSPDGKVLAHGRPDSPLTLWDVCTRQMLTEFKGHQGPVTGLAFAPDGRTLVSGSWDTTALVWDVQLALKKTGLAQRELDPVAVAARWEDLADADAGKGWDAICALVGSPKQAVGLLAETLKVAPALDAARVQALLAQMDSPQFKERQRAEAELGEFGERVVPFVDKVLAAKPTLEVRKRLEGLLERLAAEPWSGERLRILRAVEVLERVGTAEARQVLQRLADGAPGALATTSAQAALQRLAGSKTV
jgi:WD40 repeat protein